MKIISFDEFCKHPEGTIFSYYEPMVFRGLFKKGKSIEKYNGTFIDYFETSLTPEESEDGIEIGVTTRWGMYDFSQFYAVYEEKDLNILKGLIDGGAGSEW